MKNYTGVAIVIALLTLNIVLSGVQGTEFLDKIDMPPGERPAIFAEGLISDGNQQHSSLSISNDGKEIWWSEWKLPHDLDKYPQYIEFIKFHNGRWTEPETAPFSGKYRDGGPALSRDGNRLYFYSRRPHHSTDGPMEDNDIWYVERTVEGWSAPKNAGPMVNTEHVDVLPCPVKSGNLYFTSNRRKYPDPIGANDIYMAEFKNGKFSSAVNLGAPINTGTAREFGCYVDPDEKYIIFARDDRKFEDGKRVSGGRGLMISFREKNGNWGEPLRLGEDFINTRFPSVSPDGKYFFFTKYTSGSNEDFYWLDASFIKKLK